MNSFKFNSTIGTVARIAIAESLGISWTDVYKVVRGISGGRNLIMTKDGREYKLVLEDAIAQKKYIEPESGMSLERAKTTLLELRLSLKGVNVAPIVIENDKCVEAIEVIIEALKECQLRAWQEFQEQQEYEMLFGEREITVTHEQDNTKGGI